MVVRVFAESNFLLELAYEQGQAPACAEILTLAEAGRVALVIPSFSLVEPRWTLRKNKSERERVKDMLIAPLREVAKSESFRGRGRRVEDDVKELFDEFEDAADERFEVARGRVRKVAGVLPLGLDELDEADRLVAGLGLKYFDALVLAGVLLALKGRPTPSLFLNKDRRDFDVPEVREALGGCKLVRGFQDGLAKIRAELGA